MGKVLEFRKKEVFTEGEIMSKDLANDIVAHLKTLPDEEERRKCVLILLGYLINLTIKAPWYENPGLNLLRYVAHKAGITLQLKGN